MITQSYVRLGRWRKTLLFSLLAWGFLFGLDQQPSWAQTWPDAPIATEMSSAIPPQTMIEGQVWKDGNSDGLYQLDEPFLPYTVVALYTLLPAQHQTPINGTPLLTTTTTITGSYAFPGLPPGTYVLEFTTRGSMYPTLPNHGGDETKDSDVFITDVVAHGRSAAITIDNQGQRWLIDAGFVPAAQATIYVYDDTNRDNNRQMSEPVIAGAVVILHDSAGREVRRQVVDQKGAALFPDLLPGDYAATVWPPEGYADDPRATVVVSLAPGAIVRLSAPVAAAPKAVVLTTFTVHVEEQQLVIRWLTALEQRTYGYRLLRRSDVAAATLQQLTTDLIPSQGTQGGFYEVRLPYLPAYDGSIATTEFWLVEYEITGKENTYGPFYAAPLLKTRTFLPFAATSP